jgi:hypothetical protein
MVKERLHPLSNDRYCFRFGIGEGLREQISRRGRHGPGTEATQSLPCSLVCGLTFLRSFAIACLATVGVVRELVLRVRGPVVSGRIHFSLSSRAAQCVFPGVREHAWAPLRGAVDLSHQIAKSGFQERRMQKITCQTYGNVFKQLLCQVLKVLVFMFWPMAVGPSLGAEGPDLILEISSRCSTSS